MSEFTRTIDCGLAHIEDMRQLRALGDQMTQMEIECAWLELERREFLIEIGAEGEAQA